MPPYLVARSMLHNGTSYETDDTSAMGMDATPYSMNAQVDGPGSTKRRKSSILVSGQEWDISNLLLSDDSDNETLHQVDRKPSSRTSNMISPYARSASCAVLMQPSLYPNIHALNLEEDSTQETSMSHPHQPHRSDNLRRGESYRADYRPENGKRSSMGNYNEDRERSGSNESHMRSYDSGKQRRSSQPSTVGAYATSAAAAVRKPPPPSFQSSFACVERKLSAASLIGNGSIRSLGGDSARSFAGPLDDQDEQEQQQIEVAPGTYMPLRGSKETMEAIRLGKSQYVSCICCNSLLCCMIGVDMVICPDCRVLSSVPDYDGDGQQGHGSKIGGVGLGMKAEHVSYFED